MNDLAAVAAMVEVIARRYSKDARVGVNFVEGGVVLIEPPKPPIVVVNDATLANMNLGLIDEKVQTYLISRSMEPAGMDVVKTINDRLRVDFEFVDGVKHWQDQFGRDYTEIVTPGVYFDPVVAGEEWYRAFTDLAKLYPKAKRIYWRVPIEISYVLSDRSAIPLYRAYGRLSLH